ncbi:bacteriohemerythrin [Dorea acetigenes]|uniref:Bacteriohemerythrin n=1 Tax=Dorea acetigenes TaxID=2981787 RepID=A0ABT2RKZ7_9FIRM|nr:bacteriohemerythrin [Dorea acetigenes]MCB6414854.1 bacteriohemerythrin [Faecalimonas umbilicata]MCU6685849.1 bacteriohemerythrin [Dorea acetigenes]SCI68003.1 McHr [uncultured Clostridium sp.]
MYAEFTENLATGNEMIDSQHKELIQKINDLLDSCEKSSDKVVAIKTLDFLSDYTEYHFNAEEQLQKDIEYPGYDKHKAQHEEFKKTVEELHEMLVEEEGPSPAFVAKVQENVINWLYTHIQGFDRSVAEYKFMRENNERL